MQKEMINLDVLKLKKAAIINLGCKVNKYESDSMTDKLQAVGMQIVGPQECADVYIVNTCSVTNMAERKSRQMLRRAKKMNPKAVVVAAGCYVNAEHDLLSVEEFIDILISNNRKNEIVKILSDYFVKQKRGDYYLDINKTSDYEEMGCMLATSLGHQRAYIKIQDGCNQFCSYCIIPYTRGRVRSRQMESVLKEIESLAKEGIKEFVLTGIHISSYGKDFDDKVDLGDLIQKIQELPSVERIRLGSLEPRIITEDFLNKISNSDKLCPHFHLSLQSACNDTLKRMNRKYTIEEFMEKCSLLRQTFEKPAITTDVIVGFPGETQQEFEITLENLQRLKLYEIHVFKYSVRSGTVAEKMPNQVPEAVKNTRSDILLQLTADQKSEFERDLKGCCDEVLIEEQIKDGVYTGHTKRYVKMDVLSEKNIVNEIIPVEM